MSKERRQYFLKKLITEQEVETQEQLVMLLNEKGMDVTQATISRDIRELNLVKVPLTSGKFKYSFIAENNDHAQYKKLLKKTQEVVVKFDSVDNLIVLKTLPGNAHVIGVLLDNVNWDEMVGCVCGNDTCLIIARTKEDADIIYNRMTKTSF
ncbi:arginine repressor [Bacillus massiliigorillae]|uniref:arginine repressor n=1 Tax=Bacillus massiliigorillae TaxID=1243664 RepID=UPI0005AAE425|nr:arginine repressor [Bacillus massiliigorillae]